MTAIVLPDIDRKTIEELKKRIPDLSEIELPNLPSRKDVGKTADQISRTADETIDRLLGRSRAPVWPWIAAGIGLAALVGIVAAWFAWFRRPTLEAPEEQWSAPARSTDTPTGHGSWPASAAVMDEIDTTTTTGSTSPATSKKQPAASGSTSFDDRPLGSAPYEEA